MAFYFTIQYHTMLEVNRLVIVLQCTTIASFLREFESQTWSLFWAAATTDYETARSRTSGTDHDSETCRYLNPGLTRTSQQPESAVHFETAEDFLCGSTSTSEKLTTEHLEISWTVKSSTPNINLSIYSVFFGFKARIKWRQVFIWNALRHVRERWRRNQL